MNIYHFVFIKNSFSINIFIFMMLCMYVLDVAVKYLHFLNYMSPALTKYYLTMLPIDMITLFFDLLIVYFLLSARKVINERVLGGGIIKQKLN